MRFLVGYGVFAVLGFLAGFFLVGSVSKVPGRIGWGLTMAATFCLLIFFMGGGTTQFEDRPPPTTTTTRPPNMDPKLGWVILNDERIRCEGPNMIYDGFGRNEYAVVKDDPRCSQEGAPR